MGIQRQLDEYGRNETEENDAGKQSESGRFLGNSISKAGKRSKVVKYPKKSHVTLMNSENANYLSSREVETGTQYCADIVTFHPP